MKRTRRREKREKREKNKSKQTRGSKQSGMLAMVGGGPAEHPDAFAFGSIAAIYLTMLFTVGAVSA